MHANRPINTVSLSYHATKKELAFLFYKWRNWGSEKLMDFFQDHKASKW